MSSEQVQVGQVWADNDPRSRGRTLKVVAIVGEHATCVIVTNDVRAHRDRRGKHTRVALRRFKPTQTGYRLISSPGDAP